MRRRSVLLGLLLVLLPAAVYLRVVGLGFVSYDDPLYVTQNPHVKVGLTGEGIAWALTTSEAAHYWHPLTWISHMLDAGIFGLAPAGHHLTSLLLHLVSVIVLFLVLARSTGETGPSAFVALLFALHPLHVESVAWIAERKDVLSTAFFWLALGAYVLYTKRPSAARYAVVGAAYCLGLLAKPMLVTFPFVLLLMDFWPLRRASVSKVGSASTSNWPLVLEKIPFFLLAGAISVITLRMSGGSTLPLERLSLGARLANAVTAYVAYTMKTLWPSRLAVIYPHPGMPSTSTVVLCAAFLLGVTAWVIHERRTRPYLAFGWFWYLGTLVPVIGLVQVGSQALADRYTYVPLTGLFVMAAWGLRDALGILSRRLESRQARAARWIRRAPVFGATGLILACSALTWAQIGHWRSSASLFERALAVTQDNCVAQVGLGNVLGEAGRLDEASAHFLEALRINPAYGLAHYDLGMTLLRQKRLPEAIAHFDQCLRLEPDSVEVHLILGFALTREGRTAEAIAQYQECLRLKPDASLALNNLAWIRATSRDPAFRKGGEAVMLAERACALASDANGRYLATLAAAYAESGRYQDAVRSIDRAIGVWEAAGNDAAVRECRAQEVLYRAAQPFRAGEAASALHP